MDVFLDVFKMDHTLNFRHRLKLDELTISITDLLLTKLQIVKLNEKDAKDIITILEDHDIGYSDNKEMLNVDYIAQLCSKEWGLYTTITDTIRKMFTFIRKGVFSTLKKGITE